MLRSRLLTALLLRRDACWKNSFLLTVATKSVPIFIFWSRCCCCCCVLLLLLLRAAAAAAHNISTEAERGTGYCFLLLRLRYFYCCFLCVYSIAVAAFEKGCMPGKTNKKYYFVFFGGLRCCCSSLMDGDMLKKIRLVSAFCLIRVRNQSRSV